MTPPTVEEQAQNPREFYSYRNEVLSSVWEFLCEQERALEREFAARNEEGDE